MIYFDTDVLINAFVEQDEEKHRHSRELVDDAVSKHDAAVSMLSVHEVLSVLGRIGSSFEQAQDAFGELVAMQPVAYGMQELRRAVELARHIGFRNINDCIHTAIAEAHCTELVTYNRGDFRKIRDLARVTITIL